MIIVDIETSGLYPEEHGVWQIGAVEFENPKNEFLGESKLDEEDKISQEALIVIGKTEQELREKSKQSQKQLLENFFKWTESIKNKIFVSQNCFDYMFLSFKARKYKLKFPFNHRAFDLHSIASMKYFQLNKKFLIKDGQSEMGLSNSLDFCGMKDNRISLKDGKIAKQGTSHNALEDAKLEAESLSRVLYGKNLFLEFRQFPIPEYLKK
jgi:DNA polymerase III epsilon subunit-like protein